jgi:hypothetical protein
VRSLALAVVAIAFVLLCLAAGILGTFLADRAPPVVVQSVEILTPVIEPGGKLRIRYRVHRVRDCETRVDRVMYDAGIPGRQPANRVILDVVRLFGEPDRLGLHSFVTAVDVPEHFVDGPARYVTAPQFRCNPLHTLWPIQGQVRTVGFEVRAAR